MASDFEIAAALFVCLLAAAEAAACSIVEVQTSVVVVVQISTVVVRHQLHYFSVMHHIVYHPSSTAERKGTKPITAVPQAPAGCCYHRSYSQENSSTLNSARDFQLPVRRTECCIEVSAIVLGRVRTPSCIAS